MHGRLTRGPLAFPLVQPARLDVATLFEGHYEVGFAALLNSLVEAGFAGTVWAGHRSALPAWLTSLPVVAGAPGRHRLTASVEVAPLAVRTERHLTNAKPCFLLNVLDRSDADGIAYFDPDIVVRQPWPFFVEWASYGVAVCADANPSFPRSHPTRQAWLELARSLGDELGQPAVDLYVNAGFLACRREQAAVLRTWERYLLAMAARGPGLGHGPGAGSWDFSYRWSPYMAGDQDALNLAVMAHADQVSLIGPQGMALGPGWAVMAHAVGQPKPWQRRFLLDALRGRPPARADSDLLRHARGVVDRYGAGEQRLRMLDLRLARVVGRLLGLG